MNTEQVVEKILSDAKAEAEKIISQAKKNAQSQCREAEEKLVVYRAESASMSQAAADDKKNRALAAVRLRIAKETLAAKGELMGEVFARAGEKIKGLNDGEYLALIRPNGTKATEYNQFEYYSNEFGFPPQRQDISYGLYNRQHRYFGTPTPLAENTDAYLGFVEEVDYITEHGFFDEPNTVVITCPTPQAVIRYTIDSSDPTVNNGSIYDGPFAVVILPTIEFSCF